MSSILLAGGAGFIGSHTAVELLNAGYDVIICDNLCNSERDVVERIGTITGVKPLFYDCDCRDNEKMSEIFRNHKIEGVIHFAGLKAVGESVEKPVEYYRNNLDSTLTLLEEMKDHNVKKIVFSSSAVVYGKQSSYSYMETMQKGSCTNPYGWTKAMIEQILIDAAAADPDLSVVLLRYFNPIGAHESGLIGENPQGIPNNLMPFISQVAVGKREKLTVFGNDYDTPDGTCRRDYLHVMDLADGHVKAFRYAEDNTGVEVFNLGTGTLYSVLDIINIFEKVNNIKIAYEFGDRRAGDLPEFWSDTAKAEKVLGWHAVRSLEDMCRDSWNWQKNNPNGYRE